MAASLLSVNHPRIFALSGPKADYLWLTEYSDVYTFGGQRAVLTFWHRPWTAMGDAFIAVGFRIAAVSEPPVTPDTPRGLFPVERGDRAVFICFIFFVLHAH